MKIAFTALTVTASILISGCAGLDFGEQGLSYYEPKPYLFVSIGKDCVSTATVVSLPGEKRALKFKSGYGSSDLSVTLANGILTNAGQKTDTKIPETITAVASLGTALASLSADKSSRQLVCVPTATLYPIMNGVPELSKPSAFPVESKLIDMGIAK
ncbi:hypothetical protein EJA72_12300 [Pseudomonas sp. PB120]|uniref:hypothetical protein n=1 Tax=Pseudomonas sp. PB120 TaxID=2494700 RepID=UPI0012FD0F6B|nr:hypothetical protein [Pseudomonas sp. PB120]MVV49018.1 hypothetical protein [Pseudomonas sp. PB120]